MFAPWLAVPNSILNIDPVTGEAAGYLPSSSPSDVCHAVERARRSAPSWSQTPVATRLLPLKRLRSLLIQHSDELAETISREIGKPLQESYGAEVLPCIAAIDFLIAQSPNLLANERVKGNAQTLLISEPHGVVGLLSPFNYPLFLTLSTLASAVVAGNAVVWKPSELATATGMVLDSLLCQAGFPEGILQMVTGDAAIGQALAAAECDFYAFIGGVRNGRAVLAELAVRGIPSVMELSGNDAFIVCRDAHVDAAIESAVWGRLSNGGQSCVAPQRFYVARSLYDAFLDGVAGRLAAVRREERTPLRTQAIRNRCHEIVQETLRSGARCVVGAEFDENASGFFYPPTLLADCTDSMAAMAEEFFGPVIAVSPFDDEYEAISRANANPFALGASVWTVNLERGIAIGERLRVGMVTVNEILLDAADPHIPFGGMRSSGFGKLRGAEGLRSFTVRKAITVHAANRPRRHLFPYVPAANDLMRALVALKGRKTLGNVVATIQAAMQWQRQANERKLEDGEA